MIGSLLESPLLELLLLAVLSAAGRWFFLRRGESSTASGAIAMAIGIFVLGALQHLPLPVAEVTRLLALEGFIIWAFIAASYVASYFRGTFPAHTADPVGAFAIGTWVAGTAVLGRLILIVLPGWTAVGVGLAGLTLVIWLWYLVVITRRYGRIFADPLGHPATGRILLATVSTQAVVLVGQELLKDALPGAPALALILLGYVFYGLGVFLIARRYLLDRHWRLRDDWDNTNCILHGAMSISGLAAVETGLLPPEMIALTWVWVLVMFVAIELTELARLVARVRAYGWRRGIFTYHVSQWSRNFTFGMFYVFTLRLFAHPPIMPSLGLGFLRDLQASIIAWGQYVVLILLLIELALFLSKNLDLHRLRRPALVPQR